MERHLYPARPPTAMGVPDVEYGLAAADTGLKQDILSKEPENIDENYGIKAPSITLNFIPEGKAC